MIEVGDEAPTFALPGAEDGDVRQVSLSDHLGGNVVVLAFLPAAFHPRAEQDGWLRSLDLLTLQRNVAVLGVAPDGVYGLRAFADDHGIDFPLLSDTGRDVAGAYGVLRERFGRHRRVPARAVVVLDDRSRVVHRWAADDPDDTPDLDAVRDAVGGVESDGSATERYRIAYDYARYGREEFAIARESYEAGDWKLAREAFGEALDYFEQAVEVLGAAQWFAADDDLAARLREIEDGAERHRRAARWFHKAAAYRVEGADESAAEFRADAEAEHEGAAERGSFPEPEELVGKTSVDSE